MAPANRGGRGKCSVCAHPDQDLINEALAKQTPLRKLEKRWGLSRSALQYHRANHLSPALLALHQARGAAPVLDDLRAQKGAADDMYEAARAVRNMPLALAANRQRHTITETIAKVTGELDERPQVTVNIQQTQAFIDARSVIFEELEPYPEVRKRISHRLRLLAEKAEAV